MIINEDYENLYSPSKWSKRFNSEVVVDKHIKFLTEYSELVKQKIKCELNLPYGPEHREKYDIFGTDLRNDSPILVHIHGGYYQEESVTHSNNSFIAHSLYKNKIKTILIGYELSPKRTVSQILDNLITGLWRSLEYAKQCKSRGLYLCGHSAGAHAIATIFTHFRGSLAEEEQNLIKGVFLISGLFNMVPVTKMSANLLLNISEKTAKELLSPLFQKLDYGNTKFYLIVGEHDSPSFIKQNKQFFNKLQGENIKSEYYVVPNVDHFDIVEKLYYEDYELTKKIVSTINKTS